VRLTLALVRRPHESLSTRPCYRSQPKKTEELTKRALSQCARPLLWLSTPFLLYKIALGGLGDSCNYLGSVRNLIPMSDNMVNIVSYSMLAYLIPGSALICRRASCDGDPLGSRVKD
jgi:hypothetical protein